MKQPLTVDELREGFASPPPDSRPMVRWWWFGPAVERAELDRELAAIKDAGFGGVEISYVYPLAPATTEFLSADFLAHLRFAAERARELGLRFDLTLGSGWSFGGPHISPELAARKLHWERREIIPSALAVQVVAPWPGDELVAAYVGAGSVQEPPDLLTELPVVDGVLSVPEGQGPRQVLLAWSRLTGQNVKRATVGAEGPVLDHYSAAAAEEHLRRVADPLLAAVSPELVGSVFCDSLEVYESGWTPALLSEFERRRGYDARPVLYQLVTEGAGAPRLRADFYRTLTELYEQNFVAVFQRWAAERRVPFRIQGYGVPPAGVSSYRFADLYEGEGWGWREITQTRWASSAAHLYGLDVVSSETWTWVHSPSFRATPLDLKGEAHEHFLAGINQLIGHGWPYAPVDAPGLGWFFYAAGALNDRNPWWPAMPQLNAYLQRLSWLLRQGRHVADVLLYVPAGDVAASTLGRSLDLWRETKSYIGDDIPRVIREAGFDYDLVDDDALERIDPATAVVVLPFVTAVPAATRSWLDRVQSAGGSVIAVGTPGHEGAVQCGAEELASALADARAPDVVLDPAVPDVGYVHRRTADADVYFLANTGNRVQSFTFSPRTTAAGFQEWDPLWGDVRRSGRSLTDLSVSLAPYEATVVVTSDHPGDPAQPDTAAPGVRGKLQLDQPWTIRFLDDVKPAEPEVVRLPHTWESMPGRRPYSGAAAYETTFEVAESLLADTGPDRVWLYLGAANPQSGGAAAQQGIRGSSYRVDLSPPVREVAVVTLNGTDCGVLWAPPYFLDVTAQLRRGRNELRLVVCNTAANALARESEIVALAEQSATRYGRRFRMQDLDLAMSGVASGLLTTPILTW